jgi:hypothetical protein
VVRDRAIAPYKFWADVAAAPIDTIGIATRPVKMTFCHNFPITIKITSTIT